MIIKTSSGVMLHGEITRDPDIRNAGQKQVLRLNLRAYSVKKDDGNWESFFVDADLWNGIEQWDGMLQKGDYVTVFARALKQREYNGKTYYSVDAIDVQPGGLVQFRWLQNVIDISTQSHPSEPTELVPAEGTTPFDSPTAPSPAQTTTDDALVDEFADDLPF